MAGLAMTAIAAPMAVLGSIAARLSTTRVRIAVGLVIIALLATVSLPPPMAVAASDTVQVEHRAWSLSYEEWKQLCKRLEKVGQFSSRPDPVDRGHWCYLYPADSSEPSAPHPVIYISFSANPEQAKADFTPNYTRHLHRFATISVWGVGEDEDLRQALFKSAEGIVDSLAMDAKPEPTASQAPAEQSKEYRVSITSTMIPFAATVTVTDNEGDPVPNKAVQVLVLGDKDDQLWDRYSTWEKSWFPPAEPFRSNVLELIDLIPEKVTTMNAWPRMQSTMDAHRRFRTNEKGSVTVPLAGFTATAVGGYELRGYLLKGDLLSPSGMGLPFGLTVRATLFEQHKDGNEKELATAETRAVLDHVAQLVAVRKKPNLDSAVLIQRGDVYEQVSSANLRKDGAYAEGFELRPGDVIHQGDLVETTLNWYFGGGFSMIVREGRGPKEITINGDSTSPSWWADKIQKAGWVVTVGGGVIGLLTTNPYVVAGSLGVNVLLEPGSEALVGVDLVAHSVVMVETRDTVEIYTIEGSVEAYDRASGGQVEVQTGQTVTLDAATSFGPVTEFQPGDFDDVQLSLVRSAASELAPEASVEAADGVEQAPEAEAATDTAVLIADDFDSENGATGLLSYGGFAQWTVESGTVDLLGAGLYDFYPDAGLFLDLDGSTNVGGTLTSRDAFAFTPGRYRLEFDLAGHPFDGPETVTVSLGELFVEDFTMPHDPDLSGFEHFVRDIDVAGETEAKLSFRQHGGDNIGVLLDDVRLERLPGEVVPVTVETESAPSPPPEPTAARDLWLYEGSTVTRVDHTTGIVLGHWDVSHPDCPSSHSGRAFIDDDGETAWVTIADTQWDTPVLECLIRLPLDDATAAEVYPVPTGRKPTFVHDAATHVDDLWAIVWRKTDPETTLSYYDDWSLARLDRWTGGLTPVVPRVVALAPTEAGLVVLYSEKGAKDGARRRVQLGIVQPGGKAPRHIPLAAELPRTKPGTYVTPRLDLAAGQEGTVALYDRMAGRDIIVFDPATGAVVGRIAPPEGASSIGEVWPVSDGVWMSGSLGGMNDFVRYVAFDGATSLDLDPCTDVAGGCHAQLETAGDDGAWLSAWPYDGAFEVDLKRVVLRRYDDGGRELAATVGTELFKTG